MKELNFLGPGYRLYFDFIKANALMLFIIFLGLGINNTYVNMNGTVCNHLHDMKNFKCKPDGQGCFVFSKWTPIQYTLANSYTN